MRAFRVYLSAVTMITKAASDNCLIQPTRRRHFPTSLSISRRSFAAALLRRPPPQTHMHPARERMCDHPSSHPDPPLPFPCHHFRPPTNTSTDRKGLHQVPSGQAEVRWGIAKLLNLRCSKEAVFVRGAAEAQGFERRVCQGYESVAGDCTGASGKL